MEIKCLIVDDEPPAADTLRFIISGISGVEVVGVADSAESAISAIHEQQPDLVFLDIRIQDGDGFDVVRACDACHKIPLFVFITAYDMRAVNAIKARAADYILKPFLAYLVEASVERARKNLHYRQYEKTCRQMDELVSRIQTSANLMPKVSDDQLNALIGDAIPVQPEGSTLVNTIVKKGTIQEADCNSPSVDDYSFPQVVQGPNGMAMIIPDEPLPSVTSHLQLSAGGGEIPSPGEVVALTYDMLSWSTGKMVESSQTLLNGPLMYRLGDKGTPSGIPKYLDEAIHDRPYGSTVQVVLKKEMPELPDDMNPHDGYVLVVRVDRPKMDGETALEHMKNAMN